MKEAYSCVLHLLHFLASAVKIFFSFDDLNYPNNRIGFSRFTVVFTTFPLYLCAAAIEVCSQMFPKNKPSQQRRGHGERQQRDRGHEQSGAPLTHFHMLFSLRAIPITFASARGAP
jgi:hypothetical protein